MMTPEEMISYDQLIEYAGLTPGYIDSMHEFLETSWDETFDIIIAIHTDYKTFVDWYIAEIMEDYNEYLEEMEAAYNAAA